MLVNCFIHVFSFVFPLLMEIHGSELVEIPYPFDDLLDSCPSFHQEIRRICVSPQGSCGTRCGMSRRSIGSKAMCQCDDMCLAYNDCCGDFHDKCSDLRIAFYRRWLYSSKMPTACVNGFRVITGCPKGIGMLEPNATTGFKLYDPIVTSTDFPGLHFINASVHNCFFRKYQEDVEDLPIPWSMHLRYNPDASTLSEIEDFINTKVSNSRSEIGITMNPPEPIQGRECQGFTEFKCIKVMPGDGALCENSFNISDYFFTIVCGGSAMLTITTRTSFEAPEITSLSQLPVNIPTDFQKCQFRRLKEKFRDGLLFIETETRASMNEDGVVYSFGPLKGLANDSYCRPHFLPSKCRLALRCDRGRFFFGEGCAEPEVLKLIVKDTNDTIEAIRDFVVQTVTELDDLDLQVETESYPGIEATEDGKVSWHFAYTIRSYNLSQDIDAFDLYITGLVAEKIQCYKPFISPDALISMCLSFIEKSGSRTMLAKTLCEDLDPIRDLKHAPCTHRFSSSRGVNIMASSSALVWFIMAIGFQAFQ